MPGVSHDKESGEKFNFTNTNDCRSDLIIEPLTEMPGPLNLTSPHACRSALLLRVEAGEEIVLARNGRPCARLVPMEPRPQRRLGFLKGTVEESCFAPLPESELQAWEN
jgi:antitoxin (DNA-binding transcriptional repressor) of toxin-antitoxin stability system